MKVKILLEATQDVHDGSSFYEKQSPGLGRYFKQSIFSDIDALATAAGYHPRHFGTFHRKLARHFPFAIYYEVDGDTVVVHAVLDCRRNPAWIRRRLSN